MNEIANSFTSRPAGWDKTERHIVNEMGDVVVGPNHSQRLGVGLDETLQLCLFSFSGTKAWRTWFGIPLCRPRSLSQALWIL